MAKRIPQPFWREQIRCYYVQIGKRQQRLDPDENEAYRLYHELMEATTSRPAPPKRAGSESDLMEALEGIKDLVSQYGAEQVKRMVDLLG